MQTDINGHKILCKQISMDTKFCANRYQWTQNSVQTDINGHKIVCKQILMDTKLCANRYQWTQNCVQTDINGHKITNWKERSKNKACWENG